MADEPDLTAELDAADALVLHDVPTETHWGTLDPVTGDVFLCGGEAVPLSEGTARSIVRSRRDLGKGDRLVRRTVTYGPWEVVADA